MKEKICRYPKRRSINYNDPRFRTEYLRLITKTQKARGQIQGGPKKGTQHCPDRVGRAYEKKKKGGGGAEEKKGSQGEISLRRTFLSRSKLRTVSYSRNLGVVRELGMRQIKKREVNESKRGWSPNHQGKESVGITNGAEVTKYKGIE